MPILNVQTDPAARPDNQAARQRRIAHEASLIAESRPDIAAGLATPWLTTLPSPAGHCVGGLHPPYEVVDTRSKHAGQLG